MTVVVLWLGAGYVEGRQNPQPVQPGPPAAPATAGPSTQTPQPSQQPQPAQAGPLLNREGAVKLALGPGSPLEPTGLDQREGAGRVRQSKIAFLPKFAAPLSYIYNTPVIGTLDNSFAPSFIASNAIREYLAGMGVTGDIDLAGKLRATLRRSRALLQAAHAGTEAAR